MKNPILTGIAENLLLSGDNHRKKQIEEYCRNIAGLRWPSYAEFFSEKWRVSHGLYSIRAFLEDKPVAVISEQKLVSAIENAIGEIKNPLDNCYIPEVDERYVSWGNSAFIDKIIKSGEFFPTYVVGLSGNGKTFMIEQVCARNKREYIRIQITPETDGEELIGGFRLVNGNTIFEHGPVIKAMKRGAICLIDEIDRGSNKLICLQGVLEGKPVHIKRTGEVVVPAAGFNIIATANTRGRGMDSARYSAATIIDEAFLERFAITIQQNYPSESVEKKILLSHYSGTDNFVQSLVQWSSSIRKTYESGGIEDIISTRRLCHVLKTFQILGNKRKAIEHAIARFETDTREAFMTLYEKIDVSLEETDKS